MKRDWVTGFDPLLDWVAMKTTLSGTVVMTEYTLMPQLASLQVAV
jgi:hypothetical protein